MIVCDLFNAFSIFSFSMHHSDLYSCIHDCVGICSVIREQSSGSGLLMNDYKYHLMRISCS